MRQNIPIYALWSLLALLVVAFSPAHAAETTAKYKVTRNEFGQPDLQGVWNYNSFVPLERPARFSDNEFLSPEQQAKATAQQEKLFSQLNNSAFGMNDFWLDMSTVHNARSSLIIYPMDGRMPELADGVKKGTSAFAAVMNDVKGTLPVRLLFGGIGKSGPEERGLYERCLVSGVGPPPIMPLPDLPILQIFQNKDHVVVMLETIHDARIIPLDGRPFSNDRIRSWLGESRGHWEGDSLVVVTKNFNNLTQSFANSGNAYDKAVTERFTRTAANTIQYTATIDDPATFQDKIVLTFPMERSDAHLYEFACHEGNYSLPGILAGARKQERDDAQKNAESQTGATGPAKNE
jgi:hypothetical protein